MTTSKTYPAIIFRQRPEAPLQVAFAAPSSEIDSWARVPTKRTANIRNFQRAELPAHIKEVETFFGDRHNASPTSVVVGFDPIRSKSAVSVSGPSGPLADRDVEPGPTINGTITIQWPVDPDAQSPEDRIAAISRWREQLEKFIFEELQDITGLEPAKLAKLSERIASGLRSGELRGFETDEDIATPDEDELEADTDEAPPATEGATFGLDDLPEDIRSELAGQSPGERQVLLGRLFFLGQLQPEFLRSWADDRLARLYREVHDELKPGILIDGQHRIMGTKRIANVPFLVTALPHAGWPELAFQFIVTNRTAKRVPESLLISIVGNSLSKQQRNDIEERLRIANIRVGLIEAVMLVHEDPQSPFYGLLAFGLKSETGFLDAAAMRGKVIKPWFERLSPIRELFDHVCQGRLVKERTDYWKSEQLWLAFFLAFWAAVKDRYVGSDVFSPELSDKSLKTPASRLMSATVLMIFQEALLTHLYDLVRSKATTEKIPISASIPNTAAFSHLVKNSLDGLTPEFFQGWQLTGFDGSRQVREDLSEAIKLVIGGKFTVSELKKAKNPHRLFKGTGK